VLVLVLAAELPAESSACPVDDVPPVEPPLVERDTLVTPGPVENPGELVSPQEATRRTVSVAARMSWKSRPRRGGCQLEPPRISTYPIETSLYDATGKRTWNQGPALKRF